MPSVENKLRNVSPKINDSFMTSAQLYMKEITCGRCRIRTETFYRIVNVANCRIAVDLKICVYF